MPATSNCPPGTQPTYTSSLKYSARGLRGEIRLSCRLVVENTSVWVAGEISSALSRLTTNAFSLERSSGTRPASSAAFILVNRSVGGRCQ